MIAPHEQVLEFFESHLLVSWMAPHGKPAAFEAEAQLPQHKRILVGFMRKSFHGTTKSMAIKGLYT